MTTAATTLGARRGAATVAIIRRLARAGGSMMMGIGSRWNRVVDAGQFGPSADSVTSRHTGARI